MNEGDHLFQPNAFPALFAAPLDRGAQAAYEPLAFVPMPHHMATCSVPALPAPEVLAVQAGTLDALRAALAALQRLLAGEVVEPIALDALTGIERALVDQVLGEGEVAARVMGDTGVHTQESVFAGVWRVLHRVGEATVRDTIEVGAFPRSIVAAARADGQVLPPLPARLPQDAINAPAVLEELRDRSRAWQSGHANGTPRVVNLSLLPLTAGDSALFEQQLGRGRVMVLSRGYGNCRIVNTRAAGIWRVTYFNSRDMIVLDTLEVGDVPEVACAARQDLEDSAERLAEMLQWVQRA